MDKININNMVYDDYYQRINYLEDINNKNKNNNNK